MNKTAFVFPGQGSQSVGMGKDAFEAHAGARHRFEQANQVLGFSLSQLIFEGPEEQLRMTANTQPALLTVSMALYEVVKELGLKPDYMAGHSLGEYSALVAAGALTFEDAIKTVRNRGLFMEQAVPSGAGAMSAVLGADRESLVKLCQEITHKVAPVEPANLNGPGQIVVSGSREGVAAFTERAKEAGAKRVISLEVSGPFHSSLMRPAAERLQVSLEEVVIHPANVPVVANVTARPVTDPADIRELLVKQVFSPVLWEDSIAWLIHEGVDTFIEIGSGTVLAGLIRKIDKSVSVLSIHSLAAVEELIKINGIRRLLD